jgi:hypothetical protein
MHLVAFKAHACSRHICEMASVFAYIDTSVAMLGTVQVYIVNVKGKPSIVIVVSYLRSRPCSLACPNIKEADLVPHQTPYMVLYGRTTVACWIAMQTHTFGQTDGCPCQGGMRTRDFAST